MNSERAGDTAKGGGFLDPMRTRGRARAREYDHERMLYACTGVTRTGRVARCRHVHTDVLGDCEGCASGGDRQVERRVSAVAAAATATRLAVTQQCGDLSGQLGNGN